MTKRSDASVFAADPEGFREQNAGRPAADLIREAIQNVFDENGTQLDVEISYDSVTRTVRYQIVDNVPGGIRDEALIWTIWLSDKTDTPTKRGRMGRGLKELISVSDEALIVSQGCSAILFERSRGKWTRTSPRKVRPEAGTRITGFTRLWNKSDVDAVVAYLLRMRPPAGLMFKVNGTHVWNKTITESYKVKLPTVLFEAQEGGGRVQREPRRDTVVDLFEERDDTGREVESWIYEMGIPIERIDYPVSIDVGQRVPLREKRDTLTEPYRRELFAKLLDLRVRHDKVADTEMKDNHVMLATQASEHLSTAVKQKIADAWTEGRAYAATPEVARAATGQHIPVMPLRAMPQSVRDIVKEVGKDARVVMQERVAITCPPIPTNKFSDAQGRLVAMWEWIAAGIQRPCRVVLREGRPSSLASFERLTRSLVLYVDNAPHGMVDNPLGREALALLIHELAHWSPQDENAHGFEFHSDAEEVGAAIATFLYENADEASERLAR